MYNIESKTSLDLESLLEKNKYNIQQISGDISNAIDKNISTTKEKIEHFIINAEKNERLEIGYNSFSKPELLIEKRKDGFMRICAIVRLGSIIVNSTVAVDNNVKEYYDLLIRIK